MRPQGPVEVIDRATQVLRTRLADFLIVSVGVNVPIWLVLAIVLRSDWARGVSDNVQWFWSSIVPEPFLLATAGGGHHGTITFLLGRALPSLGLAVTGAATGMLVAAWSTGRALTGGQALAQVLRRGHQLLMLWMAVHVLETVTVVGLVVGPFVLGIAAPLWGMQPAGFWTTVRHSVRLSLSELGRSFLVVVLATVLAVLIGGLLGGAPFLIVSRITGSWTDLGGTAVVSLTGALPHLVMDPLLTLSMALLALDLRVRVEGADLRAELQELTSGTP
jgi:MFS family permease